MTARKKIKIWKKKEREKERKRKRLMSDFIAFDFSWEKSLENQ